MSSSLPVVVLVFLGTIITFLGLFAAGELVVVVVGLLAIVAGGFLEMADDRRTA